MFALCLLFNNKIAFLLVCFFGLLLVCFRFAGVHAVPCVPDFACRVPDFAWLQFNNACSFNAFWFSFRGISRVITWAQTNIAQV